MGKKKDLNQKKNNTNTTMNKNFQPVNNTYIQSNNDIDNNQDVQEQEELIQNDTSNKTKENKNVLKTVAKRIAIKKVLKLLPIKAIILGGGSILLLVIFIAIIITILFMLFGARGLSMSGYYDLRCDEITVIFVDKENDYEETGTGTYSLDDYVAGVVYSEVGMFQNIEIYKTFALAARTYVQEMADETCTIESSDRRQVFTDITGNSDGASKMIYEAVEETSGKVLMMDKQLLSTRYDAFCSIDKDEDYYTIKQQEQKIPTAWVESQPGILEEWKLGTCQGNHGEGISQYGAYYLATEENYTYDEIIAYYYGNDITISAPYITSIAGLDIKDTRKAKDVIQTPIKEYLNSKGSSLEHLNEFIKDSVNYAGVGTREGVVTAAVSLINFLYDNFNAKLPYDWGGSYMGYGIPASFGNYSPSQEIRGTNIRTYYNSFDCSGFVSWSIRNGGYNFNRLTTVGFYSQFSSNSCSISSPDCIGQPGDLINSRDSHVELIIGVNEEKGTYFVAQSTGAGVVMNERGMRVANGTDTRILFMESFYENEANVDQNYPE